MAKETPQLKAKKHFGQHFLTSNETAQTIVNGLGDISTQDVLEIGPGMGIITQFMVTSAKRFQAVEIDPEAATYLEQHFEKIELHSRFSCRLHACNRRKSPQISASSNPDEGK